MKTIALSLTLILSLSVIDAMSQAAPCPPDTTAYISRVRLGSINNSSLRSPSGYGDYRYLSTNIAVVNSYTIFLTSSSRSGYVADWRVSIDYNKNGSTTDAGEFIGTSTAAAGSTASLSFSPPVSAFNGTTLLHIVMLQRPASASKNTNGHPCPPPFDAGETEDYSVNISGGYCYAHGINSDTDYISNVTVGSLSNNSGNNGGYGSYTSRIAKLTCGLTYIISLSRLPSSTSRREYWSVYIDYNNNRAFESGERVMMTSGTNTSTGSFTIPFLTTTGNKRMRVLMSHKGYITDPCATIDSGEVEDYTVTILPPVLTTGKAAPDQIKAIESKEASVSVSPNPSHVSGATVTYTVPGNGNVFIRISNMSGRVAASFNAGDKTAGTYTCPLPSSAAIKAGNYVLTVEQNGAPVAHSKFVIIK